MEGWVAVVSGVFVVITTIVSIFLGERFLMRRWRAEREDRHWDQAMQMARIVDDAAESDLARALARSRLETLGVTPAWVEEVTTAHRRRQADRFFALPPVPADDAALMDQALSTDVHHDPDVEAVVTALERIGAWTDHAFGHEEGLLSRQEMEVRIFIILTVFVVAFGLLAASHIVQVALG